MDRSSRKSPIPWQWTSSLSLVLLALAASFLVSGGQAAAPASGRQGAMASLQEVTITLQDGVSPPGYAGTSDSYMELYYPN